MVARGEGVAGCQVGAELGGGDRGAGDGALEDVAGEGEGAGVGGVAWGDVDGALRAAGGGDSDGGDEAKAASRQQHPPDRPVEPGDAGGCKAPAPAPSHTVGRQ